jgi:protein gp37
LNNRFGWIPNWQEPQFFPERLKSLDSKSPKIIFMDSMSDIADWKREWRKQIFTACEKNPQHTYLFLTKRPIEAMRNPWYQYFHRNKNWWIGVSVCRKNDLNRVRELSEETTAFTNTFISVEPILEGMFLDRLSAIDWVIIGAETGNRKGRITPQMAWVDNIVYDCLKHDIPVFMKESLRSLMGADFKQQFPWQTANNRGE